MPLKLFPVIAAFLVAAAQPADSQAISARPLPYPDLADLTLSAPIVAHVRVDRAGALDPRQSAGVRPGHRRFVVDATIVALIRGPGGMPANVSYLVDLPNDSAGRPARVRRRDEFLIMAAPVPSRPGQIRLVAPDATLRYGPEAAARVRALVAEAIAPDAPARIIGIGRAFHVPGSLPGESETQIFLLTADERPISLNVLRRPGEQPRWSVALGEMVDNAARPPATDTLLWYRLACTLPPSLPAQSVAEASAQERQAIEQDYALIRVGLGACRRERARP